MALGDICVTIFLELVRVLVIIQYFNIFYDNQKKKIHMITGSLAFIITTGCYLLFNINIINLISTIAGIFIISLGYHGNITKKLLLSIMCYGLMIAIDVVAIFIQPYNIDSEKYDIVSSFISVMLFYVAVLFMRILFRKKRKTELSGQWYVLLIVSIISIVIVNITWYELSPDKIMIIGILVFLINLLLYIFYSSMLDRFIYKQENIQLKQQMNLYESQIRLNIENDTKIRLIRHDIKHHIREIKELANAGLLEEIKEYVDSLNHDIEDSGKVYNTGNIAIDGILNYYVSRFSKNDIKTDINVIVPERMEISPYDINIILGNLFDNAIENVINADIPRIMIDIRYSQGILNILVENTYNGTVKSNGDEILSHKFGEHGYGIKNINRIVKKYNGDILIKHDASVFSVGIILYTSKEDKKNTEY